MKDSTPQHEQGTRGWLEDRLGYVTASRFADIMSKGRGSGLSQTAQNYLTEKIVERLTGISKDFSNEAMEWGRELEAEARYAYEAKTMTEVKEVGFIRSKEIGLVGASPDGLIGEDGGIEIKCPHNSANHIRYSEGHMPKKYYAQIQGNLWVTERKWWDFVSYDPRMIDSDRRLYIARILPDEKFLSELKIMLGNFLDEYKVKLLHYNLA